MQSAKTQLSRLVQEALEGEEIVLAKAGRPLVVLVPCSPNSKRRRGGQLKHILPEIPENFDDASPELEHLFTS